MSSTPPPPPPPPPPGGDQVPPEGSRDPGSPAAQRAPADPNRSPGGADTGFPAGSPGAQRNSLALAALVLGLVAVLGPLFSLAALILGLVGFRGMSLVGFMLMLTPVVALVAVVLGILGIRRAKRPTVSDGVGMSVTGIVLGGINLLLTAGLIVMAVVFLRTCPPDMDAEPEQATEQMMECMAEQGRFGPVDADDLDDELDFDDL